MATFQYKAVDAAGRPAKGGLEATNEVDLELRLKRIGLDLITCREVRRRKALFGVRARITRADLISFCLDMEQMSRCGIPLLDGLRDLRDIQSNPRLRDVLTAMSEDLEAGKLLSQCLAAHPHVFGSVFVNLVRAGEQTGRLAEVFESLAASLKWQDELASQTQRLLIYPAMVIVVLCAVVVFLLLYLVPQVAALLRTMAIPLPAQTRLLIYAADGMRAHWPLVIGLPVFALFAAGYTVRRNQRAAYTWDSLKLRLPLTGPILKKIILARFASFFALMYESGITVLDALKTSEGITNNRCVAASLVHAGQQVSSGETLTESFRNLGIFPPLVIRMLRMGESTGALDVALRNVNYFYTRDVRESVDKALKLLEPALTLALGAILALIMWAVLTPVYDILGRLKF
ncbi:MAG TPA: type II secretion system F family protein [Burkholderiales bacterium]